MKLLDILQSVQENKMFFKDAELQIKQLSIEAIEAIPEFQNNTKLIKKYKVLEKIGSL